MVTGCVHLRLLMMLDYPDQAWPDHYFLPIMSTAVGMPAQSIYVAV